MKALNGCVLLYASKTAQVAPQIRESLEEAGINFECTSNVQKSLEYLLDEHPCVVVFDTETDDAKAQELCKKLKKYKEELPFEVYFLIDDNKNFELQWTWFNQGVDEFGTRDTNSMLIAQRIKNIVRPYKRQVTAIPQKGFVIDRERYMVFVNGKEIVLPRKEFELLMLLSSKPEKVFTREDIFRLVWGNRLVVGDRTIDVHIRKIREKIGDGFIVTVKGVGYKFVEK